ncbi:aconitate hydratase AcnA [Streptomyces sp. NPDC007205]|uniref:aconitate hydratase AcnA n=1 Tax=Streptomyces sp. NPDC007205 TaxID=3154316 RepID=UPI0033E94664
MITRIPLAGRPTELYSLPGFAEAEGFDLDAVPYSGKILMESLLRHAEPGTAAALGRAWARGEDAEAEMAFRPVRVVMQDYTAVPLLVDVAALRDRVTPPSRVDFAVPVHVVVDHSVRADVTGRPDAALLNEAAAVRRGAERYGFLKWASQAFQGLKVVPPGRGIVHQVNLERLATVVSVGPDGVAFPDTLVGTDSHTTMANGLGILGWGVGGLEAESVIMGLPQTMRVPRIVGVRLGGRVRAGVSAADIALTLTQRLRASDVGGAIAEFSGPALDTLTAPDRCTIANMAPEYGATAAYFPVDGNTLEYLRATGRSDEAIQRVADYCAHQRLLRTTEPVFRRVIEFDLSEVRPCLAGPNRPDERIALGELPKSFSQLRQTIRRGANGLRDGDVVIASLTSCTNTSNPRSMLAAGLLARNAVERGLRVPGHVKTSLSPGSRAVTAYLEAAGLLTDLEALGFHVAGYGCMTCNGGSGKLAPDIAADIDEAGLEVCAVLSGNRNFANRVHPQVRAGYLASPALVVALALAGNARADLEVDPLGMGSHGQPVLLHEIWPSDEEIAAFASAHISSEIFTAPLEATEDWQRIETPAGERYPWNARSTYLRPPPYLDGRLLTDLDGARVLVALGDDVSTDHISPVSPIPPESPAGRWLRERGVEELDSYGSRRGNHEVMARGAFANPRLRNHLLAEGDGRGETLHLPSGERVPIHEAARRYRENGTPLIVLAGRNYGTGSSRDWAAKGPWLLGVRAVLAQSFERIHRVNLCAMGILPLLLPDGRSWAELGLTGHEEFALHGLNRLRETGAVEVHAGGGLTLTARADVHSEGEWTVLLAGGSLPHLLNLLNHPIGTELSA